jgi:hypothetical protein
MAKKKAKKKVAKKKAKKKVAKKKPRKRKPRKRNNGASVCSTTVVTKGRSLIHIESFLFYLRLTEQGYSPIHAA